MINIKDAKSASLWRARPLKVVQNCAYASHERICGGGDKAPFTLNHGFTYSWVLKLHPGTFSHKEKSRGTRLTLNLLTWRIWWAPNNASRWRLKG
jgi:hypothetical protein